MKCSKRLEETRGTKWSLGAARQSGQITILMAFVMTLGCILAAFVIDGGVGLVEMRHAQNAADFASLAASKLMPCSVGANGSVTPAQIQSTVQAVVDQNMNEAATSWSGRYLDKSGRPISGGSFNGADPTPPPANACGIAIYVKASWNPFFAQVAGFRSMAASAIGGSVGLTPQASNLAIASLLPYARHTIYAGALGNFTVNGSMYDNSVAQCNDRNNSCRNYPQCSSGTPLNNIVCYGDSEDVFQQSAEKVTGTIYSVAPVSLDPCFYPGPPSGSATLMTASLYPQYYETYGCGSDFSSASDPETYGGLQGNVAPIADPLATLPDPSAAGDADAVCPGQSKPQTYSGGVVSSGDLSPGVYTQTVTVTGSATFQDCGGGAPGIYVFEHGLEICPTPGATVSGTNVTLFNVGSPSAADSNAVSSARGYCAPAPGPGGTVTDGLDIGGEAGASVNLTAPTSGPYQGIALYQDRSINLNIGLDDGWTNTGSAHAPDGARVTINGVVYDNSFADEPSGEVFSYIGQPYQGPYSALCTGATSSRLSGDPLPCPGIDAGSGLTNTAGTVTINGAVIVGSFGTQGGTAGDPLTLTITFDPSLAPPSIGDIKLVF